MTEARENARAMGIILEMPEEEPYEVWPECADSLEVFLACDTQWMVNEWSGTAVGIRYEALPAVMDMLDVEDRRQVFADVRVCEAEALRVQHARFK